MEVTEKKLLGLREAATYLGISRSTMLNRRREWKIPEVRVGNLVKFQKEDLDTFIKQNKT